MRGVQKLHVLTRINMEKYSKIKNLAFFNSFNTSSLPYLSKTVNFAFSRFNLCWHDACKAMLSDVYLRYSMS